ncbi:MAG: hypothetical protein HEQ20_18640 [Aphanizomenon flos-aquae KM1D3_PB]|uniref:hypothetical protein n=1 Tax=Aphanizomenon flos-aquae TaxID=1176 RepID=UPI000A512CCE|nr:hypothetical protein [Aphanizomenon flos-aquae]QSV72397.1 MAG: hypothetical protein HEQ20_18640 [Aphanizomenon flos-aquae KM1D3_PB]
MSLWQGKRQEARGKSEEGLGDFTFLYTVWFYCVHLLKGLNTRYLIRNLQSKNLKILKCDSCG